MQIRQLEMFQNTMRYGTISEAAKVMYISQPSASRLIADLEQSVGFALFIRARGRLHPSPEGLKFFQEVEKTFGVLTHLEQYALKLKTERSEGLRIAVTPALSTIFAPNIVKLFRQSYPEARITLVAHSPDIIFNILQTDDIDLAFTNKIVKLPNISEEILVNADYICVMPKNHPLSHKNIITPDDLQGQDYIELADEGSHVWPSHRELFKKYSIKTRNLYSTQRSPSAYGMVDAGLGIGIFEPFSYELWASRNVVAKPFLPKLTYSYAAYFPNDRIRSELARAFVNIAMQYIKDTPLPFADIFAQYDV
ncbi:MAG: LysR family transcriptional regulator [OCS116 cluster bacterium]|uniref:LysR family transcriptional regulator n=1 Tax=OCS116 cluster bacterium TaxID=2030921 RepID=A0A2A4Z4D2_9PROT|nr:LysR family transcriptional regulator [OCS116 cluster bacterium]